MPWVDHILLSNSSDDEILSFRILQKFYTVSYQQWSDDAMADQDFLNKAVLSHKKVPHKTFLSGLW